MRPPGRGVFGKRALRWLFYSGLRASLLVSPRPAALLVRKRTEVYPEDIQDLAVYVLGHRIWLGPHAASHGLTTDKVIGDVIDKVAIP